MCAQIERHHITKKNPKYPFFKRSIFKVCGSDFFLEWFYSHFVNVALRHLATSQVGRSGYKIVIAWTTKGMGPCLLTPMSPTLDQKVAFCLLLKYYIAHLKSSLYRNCRSRLPPMPESRADVHFDGEWTKIASGKDFLIAEDEDRLIMFATDGEHQAFLWSTNYCIIVELIRQNRSRRTENTHRLYPYEGVTFWQYSAGDSESHHG